MGHPDAPPMDFASLTQACRPSLIRSVARLVGDKDAEDVVQIALAKAAAALAGFRGEASPKGWLFRIATNAAHDWNRGHPAAFAVPLPDEEALLPEALVGAAEQERRLVREEMSACVAGILQRLPEHYQSALVLGDCEELSDRELAEALGLTVGAAKIRLHRARRRLQQALEAHCQFYRDEANVLCCDRKPGAGPDDHEKKVASDAYRLDEGIRHRGERRDVGETPTKESPMATETLPTKQKHLIGVAAAIAAGCQPCTRSFVAAAREAGACDRGVRLALETGQRGGAAASQAMATFADQAFPAPPVDAAFRAERATLVALTEIAVVLASNLASQVGPRVAAARALGATDDQIQLAARLGRIARQGAEKEADQALDFAMGSPLPRETPCACATAGGGEDAPGSVRPGGCGCGAG